MKGFRSMTAIIPPGEHGLARVEHYDVTKHDAMMASLRGDQLSPGRYCRLRVDGALVMSDTPWEQRMNYEVMRQAKGDVLIGGLGLGVILLPILEKPDVESVLVIEKSADVVALVRPALGEQPKLVVQVADVLAWRPLVHQAWDTIYFDIWPDLCTDYLDQMAVLHRRFARRKRPGGWMSSWGLEWLRYRRQQERRAGW